MRNTEATGNLTAVGTHNYCSQIFKWFSNERERGPVPYIYRR
jgi:hypothetical protein